MFSMFQPDPPLFGAPWRQVELEVVALEGPPKLQGQMRSGMAVENEPFIDDLAINNGGVLNGNFSTQN